MYTPPHFNQTDRNIFFDLIEENAFGLLVARAGEALDVVHVPFVLDRAEGAEGTLRGHVARANPIWRHFDDEVLIVFQGPHAYISPDWYESPGQVPTWNYAVAHVYGRPRLLDETALQKLLEELSEKNETRSPQNRFGG
jgi:transcriptional regulator